MDGVITEVFALYGNVTPASTRSAAQELPVTVLANPFPSALPASTDLGNPAHSLEFIDYLV